MEKELELKKRVPMMDKGVLYTKNKCICVESSNINSDCVFVCLKMIISGRTLFFTKQKIRGGTWESKFTILSHNSKFPSLLFILPLYKPLDLLSISLSPLHCSAATAHDPLTLHQDSYYKSFN